MLLAGAIYLLGTGFATGNAYSFLLSTVSLTILFIFSIVTRLEARRARSFAFEWESAGPIVAGADKETERFSAHGFSTLPFLRAHLIILGRYTYSRSRPLFVRHEISLQGESASMFSLQYPLSGSVHAHYATVIKDMFGLCRAPIGAHREKTLLVRPGRIDERRPPNVEALSGDENQNRMKSSDIERYFMRDYIPGDRERDINWKASSRFSELFTRISPVTQEKTQLITIFFRPFNSIPDDSLESLAVLDRCKSMLLFFIRSVHVVHPEYEYRVFVGNDLVELEGEDQIERFASDLASTHFRSYGGGYDVSAADLSGGAYVFTTACDTGLNEFLGNMAGGAVEVYRSYAVRRLRDEEGAQMRLFGNIDNTLPVMLLKPKNRNARSPLPISAAEKSTEEPVEVRFA